MWPDLRMKMRLIASFWFALLFFVINVGFYTVLSGDNNDKMRQKGKSHVLQTRKFIGSSSQSPSKGHPRSLYRSLSIESANNKEQPGSIDQHQFIPMIHENPATFWTPERDRILIDIVKSGNNNINKIHDAWINNPANPKPVSANMLFGRVRYLIQTGEMKLKAPFEHSVTVGKKHRWTKAEDLSLMRIWYDIYQGQSSECMPALARRWKEIYTYPNGPTENQLWLRANKLIKKTYVLQPLHPGEDPILINKELKKSRDMSFKMRQGKIHKHMKPYVSKRIGLPGAESSFQTLNLSTTEDLNNQSQYLPISSLHHLQGHQMSDIGINLPHNLHEIQSVPEEYHCEEFLGSNSGSNSNRPAIPKIHEFFPLHPEFGTKCSNLKSNYSSDNSRDFSN